MQIRTLRLHLKCCFFISALSLRLIIYSICNKMGRQPIESEYDCIHFIVLNIERKIITNWKKLLRAILPAMTFHFLPCTSVSDSLIFQSRRWWYSHCNLFQILVRSKWTEINDWQDSRENLRVLTKDGEPFHSFIFDKVQLLGVLVFSLEILDTVNNRIPLNSRR